MKNSPLKRGTKPLRRTPLAGGKVALRRTKLKQRGQRKNREAQAEKLFRVAVMERAAGKCELCLKPNDKLEAHHIVPRGRCGSDPRAHNPVVGAALCFKCHAAVHRGLYPSLLKPASHLDTL